MPIERVVLVTLFFSVFLPGVSVAEEPLSVIVVTGTLARSQSIASRVPKHVVTREDIELMSPSNSLDILRNVPGVSVTRLGGSGGLTFVGIRGGDPNFTVVMIDGVNVNDPTNSRGGGFDFSSLDPYLIEKIEVFYGSYSSVYGSDALGGVISITTRDPAASGKDLYAELGTDDQYAIGASIAGKLGDKHNASLAVVRRNGSESVSGSTLSRDQLSLNIGSEVAKSRTNWSLSVLLTDGESTSFPEDSGGDRLAVIRTVEHKEFGQHNVSLGVESQLSQSWHANVLAGWVLRDEDIDHPGIADGVIDGVPPILSDSSFERINASFINSLQLGDEVTASVGLKVENESADIDALIDFGVLVPADFSESRDIVSGFGEVAFPLGPLHLIAGIRHDDAGNVSATTGRLSANLDLEKSRVWLTIEEGFKLPSLFAIGHPLIGNEDLKPEKSLNTEIRVERQFLNDSGFVSASLYYTKYDDLIDFDPDLFTNVNRNEIEVRGVNLAAQLEVNESFFVSGSVSTTDIDTGDSSIRLRRRPELQTQLGATYRVNDRLTAVLSHVYNGKFYDSSIPTSFVEMSSFNRFDFSIKWQALEKLELSLMGDNIFNSGYEEAVGFSNPGRQLRVSMKVDL